MENEFSEVLGSWHDFYLLSGTAAAALLGLLFVAVSINIPALTGEDVAYHLEVAGQALWGMLYLLMFALLFMMPHESPQVLGFLLILLGLAGLVRTVLIAPRHWELRPRIGLWRFLWRLPIPTIAYLLVITGGFRSLTGDADWLDWLVAVNILLLAMAGRGAWEMLLELGLRDRENDISR
ncbi:MAG: hypothetical protein ACOX87_13500 [Chloroflexota bacterium]